MRFLATLWLNGFLLPLTFAKTFGITEKHCGLCFLLLVFKEAFGILTFDEVFPVGSNEGIVGITIIGQCVWITLVNIVLLSSFWSGSSPLGGLLAGVLLFIHWLGKCHLYAGPFHLCAIEVVHGYNSIIPGVKVDESVVTDFFHPFNTSRIPLAKHLFERRKKR